MTESIITAVSTLLGVAITLYYTSRKEKNQFVQSLKLKKVEDLTNMYTEFIAYIEKAKDYTKTGRSYNELYDESAIIIAKIHLFATDEIKVKLSSVSSLLSQWSSLYRKSLPTQVGETGFGFLTNQSHDFRDKANDLEPKLHEEIDGLVRLIIKEIEFQNKKLK